MIDERIESIVAEVLRRAECYSHAKRALLFIADGNTAPVQRCLAEMRCEGYVFTYAAGSAQDDTEFPAICSRICLDDPEFSKQIPVLAAEQDVLMFSGLSLRQLSAVRDLRISCSVTALLCEGLRRGKQIHVWTEALTPDGAAPEYARKLGDLRTELECMGIEFAGKEWAKEMDLLPLQMMQRVISKQDLQQIGDGPILVNRDAVFTTTAKELLARRKINVIRR